MWWCLGLALAAETDRVFVVVFDGMRDEEGVLAGQAQMPALMGELRTQGALVPLVWNRDSTVTDAAHRTIMTGRRQPITGLPWYEGRVLQRDWSPTLFEAASVTWGGGGYILGNTIFMDSQGRSLVPGYAGATIVEAATKDNAGYTDDQIHAELVSALQDDHRVVLLNIHEADKSGHAARWEGYLDGLRTADTISASLVAQYGTERTTWFFLSDHGRHRDEDGPGHGDECDGCRSSWLFALGAGVKPNTTVTTEPDLVDVATTAAWLLGAPLPSARGRVLGELLTSPPPAPAVADALVEPRAARDAQGTLHQVARRLADDDDDGALMYRQRPEGGAWTTWAEFEPGARVPEAPWVVAEGLTVWRAWRSWNAERGFFSVDADQSEDGGVTWSEAVPVARAVQPFERPALAAGGGFSGAWWSDARASGDAPATLHVYEALDGAWREAEASLGDAVHVVTEPTTVRTAAGDVTCFAAIEASHYDPNLDETPEDNSGNQDRDIWCFRGGDQAPAVVRLTDDPGVQYWPALAEAQDGSLLAAWATRSGLELAGGAWSIVTSRSIDGGATWATPVPVSAGSEVWKPVLVGGDHGDWLAALEVQSGVTALAVYALGAEGAERRKTVTESPGWLEDVQLLALPEGLWVSWSEGTGTQTHRVHDTTLAWADLAGDGSGDTGQIDEDCAGCAGNAAAPVALTLWAWRRRRRA